MSNVFGWLFAMKKSRKRGFTLVEVIVLIVIIAVVLAIAVPLVAKYSDAADKRSIQRTGHNIQIVLEAERSEKYGTVFNDGENGTSAAYGSTSYGDILAANGVNIVAADLTGIRWGENGQTLFAFTYKEGKHIIEYDLEKGGFLPVKP